MSWFYLFLASMFEVIWAFYLKHPDTFLSFYPTFVFVMALIGSIGFLSLSVKTLPLSVAYICWVGIGATGTLVLSVAYYQESVSVLSVVASLFILTGVLLIKLS